MPLTEPLTTGEIARSLAVVNKQLEGIASDLKDKPGKDDFKDFKNAQDRKHDEQDRALSETEKRLKSKDSEQDHAIEAVEQQVDKFLYWILAAMGTALTGLVIQILGGI